MDQQISGMDTTLDPASAEFVGRWNRLVSTTNWEKGRIICQWRERLEAEGAPAAASSDETWSRWVGNVSPQHVGRLRRVYQRFGHVADQYPTLFWSHFQATLDWDDAEMWLEGAVQSGWSVSQMRRQRAEALGGAPAGESLDDQAPNAEFDEDSDPPQEDFAAAPSAFAEVYDPAPSDVAHGEPADEADLEEAPFGDEPSEPAPTPVRPFEKLRALPDDLGEAFEQFKLAVLKHKLAGWQEVPRADVLSALDALKQLVTAP